MSRARRLLTVAGLILLGVYVALVSVTRRPLASLGIEALALAGTWVLYAGRFVFTSPRALAPEVAWFGLKDRWAAPQPGSVVFVGSSTIAHWTSLARDMAPFPALNRGINGARLGQVAHYVDRLVLRYVPRVVVVYAGENDLAGVFGSRRSTPEQVMIAFRALCDAIHRAQPGVPVCFVSIKPARRRSEHAAAFHAANDLVRAACEPAAARRRVRARRHPPEWARVRGADRGGETCDRGASGRGEVGDRVTGESGWVPRGARGARDSRSANRARESQPRSLPRTRARRGPSGSSPGLAGDVRYAPYRSVDGGCSGASTPRRIQ